MGYELKALSARHLAMMGLVLRGMQQKKIAEAMGLSEVAVGYIVNSGAFQSELARRRDAIDKIENEKISNGLDLARDYIEREALPSAMALSEIRDTTQDANLRRSCANDLLKHAYGANGGVAQGGVGTVVMINTEKFQFLQQVIKEAGLEKEVASNTPQPAASHVEPTGNGSVPEAQQEEPLFLREIRLGV
jgi:predicted transcriptional regulator